VSDAAPTPALPVLYWEDLHPGLEDTSPARTLTEADVVAFAGLSGDFNPIHTDVVFSAQYGLGGERLVHGLLGVAVLTGLFTRSTLGIGIQRQLVALLEISTKFRSPLRIGDTVHVRTRISGARSTSNPERGIVELERELINQDGVVTLVCESAQMIRRRSVGVGEHGL
jgi:3-hydroxybutyryl-CoA dehydratase